MDAGHLSAISSEKIRSRTRCRAPLQEVGPTVYIPPLRSSSLPHPARRQSGGDRFIPDRSAMDFDYAHFALMEARKENENSTATASPSKEAYRKLLAETLLNNRTRILVFRSKPLAPNDSFLPEASSDTVHHLAKSSKQRRYISQTAERTLDAPDLVDDYYLNLLDWESTN